MAESLIDQQWQAVQNSVQSALEGNFPIEGRRNKMILHNIIIDDKGVEHADIRSQETAKVNGRTWGVPVYADISLIDKVTGNEIDRNKIKLLTLPKPTQRYSYIVDGKERQIDNLWRLRSGVYAHVKQNGKLEAEFNLGTPLARQPRIYIPFDPEKKKFKLEHGDSGFSLYAVLKTLGVDDGDMKKAWGEQIYKENAIHQSKVDKDVNKLYDKLSKRGVRSSGDSLKDKTEAIIDAFHSAELLPDTTKATLGKPIDHVSGEALLLASKRILSVARGEIPQDDRDSLIFKELDSVEDFLGKKLSKYKTQRTILQKINHNIDRQVKVRDVISGDLFNKPISDFFSKDTLSGNPEQVNPLEMMVNHRATTIISPEMGGIKNEQSVTAAMKLINPSHFGFLDPINTPECSPPSMEIYTRFGWKRLDEVTMKDEFLTKPMGEKNFWTTKTEFKKAERIISQPYKGLMYGMDNGKISYLVTPNHRVLCRPLDDGLLLRIATADLVHNRPRFFPVAHTPVIYETYPEFFELPQVSDYDKNVGKIDMGDWAEFMGWFLSEGSTCISNFSVAISQTKAVNPNEYSAIQALLDRLPFGKWCSPTKETSFNKCHKQLGSYLKQFGDSYNKFIPDYIFTASIEARERFIEAMLLGDGRLYSNRKPGSRVKSYPQKVYTTTSPRLADDFERLAIEMGHSVSRAVYADKREERYLDVHEIRLLRHKERAGRPNSTINIGSGTPREKFVNQYFTEEYDGMVYCVTVPGGLIFTRMPNRIGMWTGNSEKTGITLHLPLGVSKEGNEAKMRVYDLKEGKFRSVGPAEMHIENVVLPDQVKWRQQKPIPITSSVKMKDPRTHEITSKPFTQGRFLVLTAQQLFDEATNLIPFLQNDQGNRTMTAARQATQAVSLNHREAPLVQVKTPSQYSFERIVGTDWAVESPVDGKIVALNKNPHNGHTDSIVIQDKDGVDRPPLQIYNHFPLNDSKSFIHATPNIKAGDSVKKNQVIADSNFTRDGTLALGTNLRVTYLPYKGYNFEDGIVISESAAKKLSSEHMHRKTIDINPERDFVDKKKFASWASTSAKKLTISQLAKIGDDGIIHVGQKVLPGDVLVTAVGKRDLVGEVARAVGRLDKKMFEFEDKSIVWDSQHEGEVVKVTRNPNGKGATVFVKTIEPAEIGDKIVGRHGNKSIVCSILPDVDMPRIGGPEGTHTEVLMNPMGVPTRINLGQALETAASKIAIKTGKPYMVQNFDSKTPDYTQLLVNQLKEHGLSDQDAMYDPHTGKKLGDALNGSQYIMKLKHQVEKKLAVRSAGPNYSIDRAPKGTGAEHPGQAIGQLEFYALLAHGARHNLREMATYKAEEHLGDNNNKLEATEFWQRVQTGQPLPMPKIPFVYKKFEAMLTGLGINVKKEGNELILQPLTDKGILNLSNGEIKDPGRVLRGKDAKELEKGLFDPKVTGGLPTDVGKGLKWCFYGATKIITDRGPLYIETIVSNKLPVKVLSKNIKTGELEYKKVVNYWSNTNDKPLLGLYYNNAGYLEDFARGLHVIWCTPGHEIYSTEGKTHAEHMEGKTAFIANWAPVNGVTSLTTVPVTIDKIDRSGSKVRSRVKLVYNIEVEDNNNYFANGLLVGNSHIALPEPVPNPIFVGTKQHPGPAVILSGLKFDEFESVARGQKSISVPGRAGEKTGGQAISDILSTIKVKPEIEKLRTELPKLRGTNLDKANRKIKYLMAIDRLDIKPTDAYILKNIPVLPPIFRPIITMPDGSLRFDDINHYYKALGHINHQFETAPKELGEDGIKDLREDLYDITRSLAGVPGGRPIYESNRQMKGLLDTIAGNSPKEGYFQKRLMKRRQELSMRSTIIPEPAMHLDHVGLPKDAAMELYKPFVVREMQSLGYSPLQALKDIKEGSTLAWKSLQLAMDKRPVLLKRDPALHKFSIMAFKPKITEGRAIKIHPLVTGGFNADFDGNCFVGESKIVLKFCDKDGKATDVSSVEKEFTMKFIAGTTIQVGYDSGVIIETEIQQVPYISETGRPDKNGATVYDVPDGIFVLSYDHVNNLPKFCQVKCITVEASCKVAKVITRSGLEVTASTNESLCVYDQSTQEIKDICPKDAVGKLSPVIRKIPTYGTYGDFEFGWMIGAFVSDGFINGDTIGIVKKLDSYRNRFYNAISSYEGKYAKRTTFSEEHSIEQGDSINGLSVKDHIYDVPKSSQLLNQCFIYPRIEGQASLSKKLPNLSSLTQEALIGVLLGLLEGDRSLSISHGKKRPQVMSSFGTSSQALVDSVKSLCRFLGVRVGVTPYDPKEGRLQKHRAYIVTFSVPDLEKYASILLSKHCDPAIVAPLQHLIENKSSKDDRDIVPVPEWVMSLCASTKGPVTDSSVQRSLATIKSARKSGYYVSRDMAKTMLSYLTISMFSEQSKRWYNLVYSEDIHWDVITEFSDVGSATVYDLVVPETKVFAVNDGLVVWDTMSAFVPLGDDAVRETYKMFPSNNLFSSTTGGIMYAPEQEALMGLHLLSRWGTKINKEFSSFSEALKAKEGGSLKVNDVIKIGGHETTLGRALIAQHLPDTLKRNEHLNKQFLDPKFELTSKDVRVLLEDVAKHDPKSFAFTVDNLKDLGNKYSYELGFSFGLKDLKVDKELRDGILKRSDSDVAKIKANSKLTPTQKHEQVVDVYTVATKEMVDKARPGFEAADNSMYRMVSSGSRGKMDQFRQMTIAPMLMKDGAGNTLATPVRKSYSEGLDIGDYWTSLHGARMGTLQRVEGTSEPGVLTKEVVNVVIPNMIVSHDCGTTDGVHLNIDDRDIYDRYLAAPIKLPNDQVIKAGTIIDANITSTLKKYKIDRAVVRSPLKCAHGEGLCARCYGLSENGVPHEIGTNIGVIAGQALGEPATQLAMNSFHTGGVAASRGGASVDKFTRLNNLLEIPKVLKNAAVLSRISGTVTKVERDTATNGWNVHVGDARHFIPAQRLPVYNVDGEDRPLKVGLEVKKGRPISDGHIDPRELLHHTDIHTVQNHLTNELYNSVYKDERVRRRNIETVVRSLTNYTKISEPGDSDHLPGDYALRTVVEEHNRNLPAGAAPIIHHPILKGAQQMALDSHEDWMARLNFQELRNTILEGTSKGWRTNLHGSNPIPAYAIGATFGLGTPNKKHNY